MRLADRQEPGPRGGVRDGGFGGLSTPQLMGVGGRRRKEAASSQPRLDHFWSRGLFRAPPPTLPRPRASGPPQRPPGRAPGLRPGTATRAGPPVGLQNLLSYPGTLPSKWWPWPGKPACCPVGRAAGVPRRPGSTCPCSSHPGGLHKRPLLQVLGKRTRPGDPALNPLPGQTEEKEVESAEGTGV